MNQAKSFKNRQRSFWVDGINIVKPNHPSVHALQEKGFRPKNFGCRVWPGSYLMMHYLRLNPLPTGARVLELGAGWGVLTTYVSRHFQACATALDIDTQVLPYQKLIADRNNINITSIASGLEEISPTDINQFDYILGADICYNATMKSHIKRLIRFGCGTYNDNQHPPHKEKRFLISDTGRKPFTELSTELAESFPQLRVTNLKIDLPTKTQGYVLEVPISCQC